MNPPATAEMVCAPMPPAGITPVKAGCGMEEFVHCPTEKNAELSCKISRLVARSNVGGRNVTSQPPSGSLTSKTPKILSPCSGGIGISVKSLGSVGSEISSTNNRFVPPGSAWTDTRAISTKESWLLMMRGTLGRILARTARPPVITYDAGFLSRRTGALNKVR